MSGYTPVFRSILQSTIWETPPHVKVVWWTMLLMCDKNGVIEGSVPGLARLAVVSREQCEEALEILMSPDKDSRTTDHDGRRVERIDGGWRLLNYQKYRDKVGAASQANRERVARHRQRCKGSGQPKEPEAQSLLESQDDQPAPQDQAHVTPVMPCNVTSITCNDVTPCNGCNGQSNDLNIAVVRSKSDLSSGSDAREADHRVSCPLDLRLTEDQIGALAIGSGIPPWAIEQSTAAFVANYIADPTDKRQLVHWQKCLSKAVIGDWGDPKRRPKKPGCHDKPASVDADSLGVVL